MEKSSIDSRHKLHDALTSDHAKLEGRFDAILEEMQSGNAPGQTAEWTQFEEAVLSHFDAEEKYLLPIFEAHDPDSATVIRNEHEEIRKAIRELGLGVDLRTVREQTVRELVQKLRAHAAHEEKLYRFADREASDDIARSVLDRLRMRK